MNENKIKNLEFIQNVITRLNTNSFFIKGWALTLVSALFALAAKDANTNYVLITFVIIPTFWILDGFYVSSERQYRCLYDEVRKLSETQIDFNMDAKRFNTGPSTWLSGIFSFLLLIFYGVSITVALIVMFFLN